MVIVTGLPLLVQLSGIVDDRAMRTCPRFAVDNLPPSCSTDITEMHQERQ